MRDDTKGSVIKKALRIAAGLGLTLLGVIGLIMPVMPGWVFLIPGLVILADYFPPIKRLLDWAKAKAEGVRGATGGAAPRDSGQS